MPIMKSLNLRFAVANIRAMEDLVKAGRYGSVADLVRMAVRDLLVKEYYGREVEIEKLIALSGQRNDTYGSGDRAKGYKASQKPSKPKSSVTADTDETEGEESEAAVSGTMGIGGIATGESVPTIQVKEDSSKHSKHSEHSEQEDA